MIIIIHIHINIHFDEYLQKKKRLFSTKIVFRQKKRERNLEGNVFGFLLKDLDDLLFYSLENDLAKEYYTDNHHY